MPLAGRGVEWREERDPEVWDRALAELGGHPLQSALWGEARRAVDRITDHRLMAMRHGRPVWMMRYELRRAGPLGRIAWAPRGPTSLLPLDADRELQSAAAASLEQSGIALMVTERWRRAAALAVPNGAKEAPLTFWLDLSQGRDAVWSRLDKQWRYGVSRAKRAHVSVTRTRSEADLEAFFALCVYVSRRKGFQLPGSLALMRALLAADRRGAVEAQLFVASHRDRLGAGVFLLRCGHSVHYIWGGMDRELSAHRVGEAVHWAAIEWALAEGCTLYDLEGASVTKNPGTYAFKKKMGGDAVPLVGKQYIAFGVRGRLAAWADARLHA